MKDQQPRDRKRTAKEQALPRHISQAERKKSVSQQSLVEQLEQGDAVMQPLYYEEVDHQIEEVGIMAIKEVKYVTEKEWQRMIEMQKNQQEIWKYLESISKYQKRFQIANKIPRNSKGQFASKQPLERAEKTKQIRKRGRPRKHQPE